ncbi:MAG: hypothetical protein ACYC0Q_09250 [Eubacteriales bacterium]
MSGSPEYLLISDIAKQYWCHFESIIRCRDNEELARLQVEEVKKRSQGGNSYDVPPVEKSFYVIPRLKSLVPLTGQKLAAMVDDNFEKINYVYTDETLIFFRLEPELFKKHFGEFKGPVKIKFSDWLRLCGKKLHPCDRGDQEKEFSEKYSTVNAFWGWEGRCVSGIPDGLADEFVYVFMPVENYHTLQYVKPVAMAEAWLYAFFFNRPRVRVQIRVRQVNKIETFVQMSNNDKAIKLLTTMKELLEGKVAPLPPDVNWKCKNCALRQRCQRVSPA